MSRLVLGLDIGIASVGWGIIDLDSNHIVDAGVRLFTEATKENNEKRRSFRGSRRLKRRRVNRKSDLKKILEKYDLYAPYPSTMNPYYVRCKGLNESLSKEELNAALFHICKHRGSSLEVVEEDENKSKEEGKTKIILMENDQLIKSGKYVCEIQLDRLKRKGKIRGIENNFRSSDYDKELKKLLETQKIDCCISEEIIACILRRRHFDEGPGSFQSQTIYGRIYNDDGSVKVGMIEKMIGKCSIYPDELRSPKFAPSAEFYNLLNDLNNLKIDEEPLDIQTKQNIVKLVFEKGSITPNQIAKTIGIPLEDIHGFRIDKESKPLITKLEGFKTLKTVFENHYLSHNLSDFHLLDNIAVVLTKTKVKEERIKELYALGIENEDVIKALSELSKFTSYHSFSLKALYKMNEELFNTTLNQMQILKYSGIFEFESINQKGLKKISVNNDAVLSPVALRSYRQAIKVVNAARRKYGEFDSIVVETTRDKNSAEQKKRINDNQKYYEKINKQVEEIMEGYPGIKITNKLRTKIRLYIEQEGKSAYTQKTISLENLILDAKAYEVDHMIPLSISLDDSINNKVLCTNKENQEKGQLTPFMAFEKGKFSEGSMKEFVAFAKGLYNKKDGGISYKKYCNYVYAKDISKYENMKEFIARNLVDTSYANRLVFNTLMSYFKDNDIDTKVHTIKSQATSAFRKRIKGLEKDRDADYSHHAIDAIIVASIKKLDLYNKLLKDFGVADKEIVYNAQTGEVIQANDELLLDERYMYLLNQLVQYPVTKYSHQVDTKPNRSIADQTIYSTRNVEGIDVVVKKYKNIYDPKFTALANDIVNEKTGKYLMAKHDPQTFEKIKQIVMYYFDLFKEDKEKVKMKKGKRVEFDLSFNPLYLHLQQTGEYITKYSKKNNGPVITAMKYLDGALGSHVDISHNYETKDKKVVLQQISPYRTDFYVDNGVYKFVTIRYANVKYCNTTNEYFIDANWYDQEKEKKKISNQAKFLFSMHRNEYIEITNDSGILMYKFTATNNDKTNQIEVKPIHCYEKKQIMLTIGKKTLYLAKYSCDILGQLTEIKDSVLKLRFK